MHPVLKKIVVLLGTALLAFGGAAQAYPDRPIRLVQQFAPGGGSDSVARPLAPVLEKILGQTIIVENKPGANGVVANQAVANAAPDGYTLLFAAAGPMVAAPHLYDLRIDPQQAFVPVALVVKTPYAILAHRSTQVSSLKELLDLAREKPGTITYGTSGVAGAPHLAGEMLSAATGIKFLPVAYKGMGPAMNAVLGGEVDFAFADIAYAAPHIESDRVKILAVTGDKRSAALPDVPTVKELGIADYASGTWYGIFAAKGTPQDVIDKVNAAVNQALAGDLSDRFVKQGMDPASDMNARQFAEFVKTDYERLRDVIKQANIKIAP
ncbi:tripartite tricarboxylate transporter substrate binding protein [Bordetella sp. BOR01]|uniref:Bug family tripartite tricarboxylate transporter substrate binding protein n=1 Tax=Bordetella sp. BOR01 TaxID=2854779 RepID=UPI001C494C9F|nr:tripartite tricarboxylate transporter substrate binding protein [Bordetella sp. BOR01]MBV7484070.1 tripartite tricarboxylate transporter substrate binding protein [Bordetella sp. BOR01]